jgi:alpha-mannosidase
MLGADYPAPFLDHAWRLLLQNQPHDSICGCSVDAVHEENMIRFARAEQVARAILDRALDTISDSVVPAPPSIIRVVAVNTDVRRADHVIEASIDLPVDSAEPWRTVDAQALDRPVVFWPESASIRSVTAVDGSAVPFQILDEERVVTHVMSRYETPWALNSRRIRLLWRAPELPSCGYSAFDLEIGTVVPAAPPPEDERSAENEHLRLVVDDRGRFDVVDKRTGTQYRNIAAIEDVGDVGDEYNYSPPRVDRRITTADAQLVGVARSVAGPLRTILRVEFELPLPRRASADRTAREGQTTVNRVVIEASLDAGAPRVALRVTIDNQADDHRLRLLFPTGADAVATARADTAFDVVTRPARVPVPAVVKNEAPVSSAPMISVVDAGDGRTGATIIASGLMEYEVVGSDGGDAIALTLLRAVGDLSRNDLVTRPSGHAGPPVATPGAQCRGPHHFELAFQPRAQPPAAGELLAASRAHWIQPQIAVVRRPDGKGPVSRSFLDADVQGAVVLSALKRAEDREAVIVRVFNPNDGDAVVSLKSPHARRAHAVDCLEERQRELRVAGDGAVVVGLGPHRIETVELEG